jgi:hypothetical protein
MNGITKDIKDKELIFKLLSFISFVIPFILIQKIAKNAEEPSFSYKIIFCSIDKELIFKGLESRFRNGIKVVKGFSDDFKAAIVVIQTNHSFPLSIFSINLATRNAAAQGQTTSFTIQSNRYDIRTIAQAHFAFMPFQFDGLNAFGIAQRQIAIMRVAAEQ